MCSARGVLDAMVKVPQTVIVVHDADDRQFVFGAGIQLHQAESHAGIAGDRHEPVRLCRPLAVRRLSAPRRRRP